MFKLSPFASLALCLLSGCGTGIELVPVSGIVTLDGAPLPFKSVMFVPENTEIGVSGGGNTQEDGSYSVFASMPGATTDQTGLPPGKYRVMVFDPIIPIKQDMPVQSSDETDIVIAVAPDARPRKRDIPAIYTNRDSTPLVVEVPAEGGTIDLQLKTRSS